MGFEDQVAYVAELIGIDHVGLRFDFFDFIYWAMPHQEEQRSSGDLQPCTFQRICSTTATPQRSPGC